MTAEEKRALIAERIMGWREDNPDSSVPCWYSEEEKRSYIKSEFNLENDLNLCARVEAKIAAMGRGEYYALLVLQQLENTKPDEGMIPLTNFPFITAPAPVRVDAIVALIQSMWQTV